MNLEAKFDKLKDEVSDLKGRLESHLKVADFVDESSQKKLEEVSEKIESIEKELDEVSEYIITQKAEKKTVKVAIGLIFKIIGAFSVAGTILYSFFRFVIFGMMKGP